MTEPWQRLNEGCPQCASRHLTLYVCTTAERGAPTTHWIICTECGWREEPDEHDGLVSAVGHAAPGDLEDATVSAVEGPA